MNITKIKNYEKIRDIKLRRVIVEINGDENVTKAFVGKELFIQNSHSTITVINPIFMELILNTSLNHKNCNNCEDIIVSDNTLTLLFKEAIGDLNRITRKTLPELMSQISQIIDAVKYLHGRRIIHGDIKPENFLLFDNNKIKICDYGNSLFILNGSKSIFGKKMYTANYRSPEVWNNNEWGFSADIWALGCTIFYLVYGVHLFPEQTNSTCYISCLKSWETHGKNLVGNPIKLPLNWTNPEYFTLNALILRMCNPNESERPSIFDVESEFNINKKQNNFSLSTSPDLICHYDKIFECVHIAKCKFNPTYYISPAVNDLNKILTKDSYEYKSLVFMIYFYLTTTVEFDRDLYIICDIISCSMLGKKQSSFGISNLQVDKIKNILENKKFSMFKFSQYFGIYD